MIATETMLKQVLADVFGVDVATVGEESSVDSIAAWDSLNHLNLVLALEERFGVSFSEEQIVEMMNFLLVKAVLEEAGVEFR